MDRMKTFWRYFIVFVLFYLIINGLTYLSTRPTYTKLNSYELEVFSPKVTITEAKNKYSGGYIEGTVENNTNSIINLGYLKFEFYDEDEAYVGTEFKELKYFNVGETQNFRIEHTYKQVDNVIISLQSDKTELPPDPVQSFIDTWWPAAFIIVKLYVFL